MKKLWLVFAISLLIAVSAVLVVHGKGSSSAQLPVPSGPFAIGRCSFDWIDRSRTDALSPDEPGCELMVYVWYPAAHNGQGLGKASPYLSGAVQMNASGHGMSDFWGPVWPMILSGQLRSHASEDAPIAGKDDHFPLLLFSSGAGLPDSTYTVQIESLVSHGYIVAAVERTHEVSAVVFPNGRVVPSSPKNAPPPEPPNTSQAEYDRQLHSWEEEHYSVWAEDIRFVLEQMDRFSADAQYHAPFLNKIDLARVGVFGHSMGGMVAARACELDLRIKACINEDGRTTEGPIVSYQNTQLPSQPFMWLRANHRPSDEALARHHYTRERYDHEIEAPAVKELEECGEESYRVTISTPGITHMSFSDKPLLEAGAAQSSTDLANATNALTLIDSYTQAFFDKYLKASKSTLLDVSARVPRTVVIERYNVPK